MRSDDMNADEFERLRRRNHLGEPEWRAHYNRMPEEQSLQKKSMIE